MEPAGATARRIVAKVLLALLRVRVVYRDATLTTLRAGPAVVVCNHVSYLDGVLLALASPVPMVFTSELEFARLRWWSRIGMAGLARMGFGSVQPLDLQSPFGLRSCVRSLRAGRSVVLFPEGRISPDGRGLQRQPGAAWLAERADVPVVALRVDGAHRSWLFAKGGTQLWPRILLVF